jgi:starvation-inducible DNA-binding protein
MPQEVFKVTLKSTRIDLPEAHRAQVSALLNDVAITLTDLYVQTKLAHWNVRGPHFIAYHELFDAVASHVQDALDSIAERAVTLGSTGGSPVGEVAEKSPLEPWPITDRQDHRVIRLLSDRLAVAANQIRVVITKTADLDADSSDLFTEISRQLDKDLWFLEAHQE